MENTRNWKLYEDYLKSDEKAEATIKKYLHEVDQLFVYIADGEVNKDIILQYRNYLSGRYKAQTVNGKLSAIHSYLEFMNLDKYKVKFLKVQKKAYIDENRELTERDYRKLMECAERSGKSYLYYLMMVLYATGIRISELPCVTVEAVCQGKTEIYMKGKYRMIIFPKTLVKKLKEYTNRENIKSGCIFRTKNGKNLDRSNICHSLKKLCKEAKVDSSKVFPHNFRHLFARTFYSIEKNLAHLADILGHSSIETTRIYVAVSTKQYEKIMDRMELRAEKKPRNNYSVVFDHLM